MIIVPALITAMCLQAVVPAEETATPSPLPIPYVATRYDTARDMLWLADVTESDIVYDLGSGDGRILIEAVKEKNAHKAVGIEIDSKLVEQSRANIKQAGLTGRIEVIHGDLFKTDFTEANVVTLFLGHKPNLDLRPKLIETLKPGSRVVSHQFGMGEWVPKKELTIRTVCMGMWGEMYTPFLNNPLVPDYTGNEMHFGRDDKIMIWVIPAAVAGTWKGIFNTKNGLQELQIDLHQDLTKNTGTYKLSGTENHAGRLYDVDLWGNHIRFWSSEHGNPRTSEVFDMRFDGYVHNNTLTGTLVINDFEQRHPYTWKAIREEVNLAGQWKLTASNTNEPVVLKIDTSAKRNKVACEFRGKEKPVTDFYDFGGGFYFTQWIGSDWKSGIARHEDDESGWLIGEGILSNGKMTGNTKFYGQTSPFKEIEIPE